MDKAKQKRLEAKGWKFGDAADFCNLTPEEVAYIDFKIALCALLKQTRQDKKMSQIKLAKLIKSSQSRVAKMEGMDSTVSIDQLIKSLLALGTTQKDLVKALSF